MHRGLRQLLVPAALFAATASGALPAQVPPGPPMPVDTELLDATPAPGSPADVRWRAAKDALQAGNHGDAVRHLLAALEFHPASPALLLEFVRATADAPDARAL